MILNGWSSTNSPLVLSNGELLDGKNDLSWSHDGTYIRAFRVYRTSVENTAGTKDFGTRFNTNLRSFLREESGGLGATVHLGSGQPLLFTRSSTSEQEFDGDQNSVRYRLYKKDDEYTLRDRNGYEIYFDSGVDPVSVPANVVSTRNRFGQGQDFTYDENGDLESITLAGSANTINLERDDDGHITLIRDYASRSAKYEYDGHLLTKVEDGCACSGIPKVQYRYDASDRLTRQMDAASQDTVASIVYDGSDRVLELSDGIGGKLSYDYDTNKCTVVDRVGTLFEYKYDGDGRPTTKNTIFSGKTIPWRYGYDTGGQLTKMVMPNGSYFETAYDARGNMLSKCHKKSGGSDPINKIEITYNSQGSELSLIDVGRAGTHTYQYDSSGFRTRAIRGDGSTHFYKYDAKGFLTRYIDSTTTTQKYEYNSLGFRTKAISDSAGSNVTTAYTVDSLGRRLTTTTPEGHLFRREFDSGGRVTKTISGEGTTYQYAYDSNRRHTKTDLMDGGSPLVSWTKLRDVAGRLTRQIDPGPLTTDYVYDADDRLVTQTQVSGLRQVWTYDGNDRVVTVRHGNASGVVDLELYSYTDDSDVSLRTDAAGRAMTFAYDDYGRLTRTTDPLSHYTQISYDTASQAVNVKRYASGGSTLAGAQMFYDVLGRAITRLGKADPTGSGVESGDHYVQMIYDGEDRLRTAKRWIDGSNATSTRFAYDGLDRLTGVTDADGFSASLTYDKSGRNTLLTDPNGRAVTMGYDKNDRLSKMTDPLGHYATISYDLRDSVTRGDRYASGGGSALARSIYAYDSAARATKMAMLYDPTQTTISDSTDTVVEAAYNTNSAVTSTISASDNTSTLSYDAQGRVITTVSPDGSYSEVFYDISGIVTKQIGHEIVAGSTKSFRVDHQLDALGRVTKTINQGPDGTLGSGSDDLTTAYVYDQLGRVVTTTDEAGRNNIYAYDALSRRTAVTEDAGGIARLTNSEYDRAGRLVRLIAYTDSPSTGPQTTTYAYNNRDLPQYVTYEETGTVTHFYDAAGIMTSRKDEEAVQVDYFYDSASRLTKREKNGASAGIDKYTYDSLGRLITADCGTSGTSSSVSRSILSYDPISRITQESQALFGGSAKLIKFTLDKAGNRISTIYHDNLTTLTYGYDSRDRGTFINKDGLSLASYSWFGSMLDKRQVTSEYSYDCNGTTDRSAFKTEFQREGLGRVTKVLNELITRDQAHTSRCNLGSWTYSYDAASNPLTEIHAGHSMSYNESSRTYSYDTLNRVTQALLTDRQDWSSPTEVTTTYTYDDLGNRISSNERGIGAIGYGHDKANRMTTLAAVNPAYDLSGNLTLAFSEDRNTSYKYRYDHLNRLTGIYDSTNSTRKAAFTYDAFGRRIEFANDVSAQTQRYYYDGANEVDTFTTSNFALAHWVHGLSYIDERVMMWVENTIPGFTGIQRPYYYAIDRTYNVRGLVDRAGALVERYVYDPYGKPLIRECPARGDFQNNGVLNTLDLSVFNGVKAGTYWDPRADLNDDGLVDAGDTTDMQVAKQAIWNSSNAPTVAQAFSDVGNPFMFQGRPNFPIDTAINATTAKNWLNDFRNRFADPTGRWLTRDPIGYAGGINLYELLASRPTALGDPFGFAPFGTHSNPGDGGEGDADAMIRARTRAPSDTVDWMGVRTAEAVLGVTDRGIAIANGVAEGAYNAITDPWGSLNRWADRVVDRTSFLLSLFLYGVDPRDFSSVSWDQRFGAGMLLYGQLLGFVELGLNLIHFECFAEGTLVATPDGPVPIETLRVGARVVSDKSDCDSQWMDFPDDLLQIELQAFKVDGSSVDITLLRSKGWVSETGVAPGRTVELTIPEIALDGDATVLSVGPAPTIRKGPGRVIRSTIRSLSDEVLEVSFEDGSQPLLVTVQHRLFSADRNDWVAARDLHAGETLQTRHGFLRIKSIQLTDRRYAVYNLQVDADSTYFVASREILCHNAYPFGGRPDGGGTSKSPRWGIPNTIREYWRWNAETGRWERSVVTYDEFGRQVLRTDYDDHGRPADHYGGTHHHEYDYRDRPRDNGGFDRAPEEGWETTRPGPAPGHPGC